MEKLLSLCIPTNGISEWVFPVIESIYNQNADEILYEIVVCDNGTDLEFYEHMQEEKKKHMNLVYKRTTAFQFHNQIESFKLARGKFIKFVNHRTIMLEGSVQYLLDFIKEYENSKPTIYFSNGLLNMETKRSFCNTFDEFVEKLSFYSSWSGGLALWKQDFLNMPEVTIFNGLFPHITILFYEKKKSEYIVDDRKIFEELATDDTKKGRYNLFQAFAVEYPAVICDLYRENAISINTLLKVKKEILRFIADLYWNYIVKKEKSSYDLTEYKKQIQVFFSMKAVWYQLIRNRFCVLATKIRDKR